MDVVATPLAGVLILKPKRFQDPRGFFTETYNKQRLKDAGIDTAFVQDNLSVSKPRGTLRGLHFQWQPAAQVKLVSVPKGSALDAVVDLRKSSSTFGQHFSVTLSADEGNQLYVPAGFAHGFITLEPDTHFFYKVSSFYSPQHDAGIRFDDPAFGIDWGMAPGDILTSEKDRNLPSFDSKADYFP